MLAAICSILLAVAAQPADQEAFDQAVVDSMCWIVFSDPDQKMPPLYGVQVEPGLVLAPLAPFELFDGGTAWFECCAPAPILGVVAYDLNSRLALVAIEPVDAPNFPGPVGGEPPSAGENVRIFHTPSEPDQQNISWRLITADITVAEIIDLPCIGPAARIPLGCDDDCNAQFVVDNTGRLAGWMSVTGCTHELYAIPLESVLSAERTVPTPMHEFAARARTKQEQAYRELCLAGMAFLEPRDTDDVISHATEAIALDPNLWEANLVLGFVRLQLGDYDAAIAALETVTMNIPDELDARIGLANAITFVGRQKEAVEAWQRVIDIAPESPAGYIGMGFTFAQSGEATDSNAMDGALPWLEMALDRDPGSPEALSMRANVYFMTGNVEKAIGAFDDLLAAHPDRARDHSTRGMLLLRMNRTDDAIESLRTAHELEPDDINFAVHYSMGLEEAERIDEMLDVLQQNKIRHPDDEYTWYCYGKLRTKHAETSEDLKRGLFYLDRATEMGSEREELHYWRAVAFGRLGRTDEAREAFDRIPESLRESESGQSLREWLDQADRQPPD